MENNQVELGLASFFQLRLALKVRIMMCFIRKLIHEFKVTDQDLHDAGVYIRGRNL